MPDRSRRVRLTLFGLAVAALLLAGAAFAYAIAQNRHTASALAAEISRHCLVDTAASNDRRKLDLALIKADEAQISRLLATLPHARTRASRELVAGQILWLHDVLDARRDNLPAYDNPARC